jgi:hypothetical protein
MDCPVKWCACLGVWLEYVDAGLRHHLYGQRVNLGGWLGAGTEHVQVIAPVVAREPFRHLGAARVASAEDKDGGLHGSSVRRHPRRHPVEFNLAEALPIPPPFRPAGFLANNIMQVSSAAHHVKQHSMTPLPKKPSSRLLTPILDMCITTRVPLRARSLFGNLLSELRAQPPPLQLRFARFYFHPIWEF